MCFCSLVGVWDEQTAGIFSKCKVKSVLLKGASSPILLILLRLRFPQPLQLSCSLSRNSVAFAVVSPVPSLSAPPHRKCSTIEQGWNRQQHHLTQLRARAEASPSRGQAGKEDARGQDELESVRPFSMRSQPLRSSDGCRVAPAFPDCKFSREFRSLDFYVMFPEFYNTI